MAIKVNDLQEIGMALFPLQEEEGDPSRETMQKIAAKVDYDMGPYVNITELQIAVGYAAKNCLPKNAVAWNSANKTLKDGVKVLNSLFMFSGSVVCLLLCLFMFKLVPGSTIIFVGAALGGGVLGGYAVLGMCAYRMHKVKELMDLFPEGKRFKDDFDRIINPQIEGAE